MAAPESNEEKKPDPKEGLEGLMKLFMELLELLLKLLGISLGGGGPPIDDKFLEGNNGANRDMVKEQANKMLDTPFAKPLLSLGLKIPGVSGMIKQHLNANPNLAALATEVLNEPKNSGIRDMLAKDKGFRDVLKLAEPSPNQQSTSRKSGGSITEDIGTLQKAVNSSSFEETAKGQLNSLLSSAPKVGPASGLTPGASTKIHDVNTKLKELGTEAASTLPSSTGSNQEVKGPEEPGVTSKPK